MQKGTMKKAWMNQILKAVELTFNEDEIVAFKATLKLHCKPMTVRPVIKGNHWLDPKTLGLKEDQIKRYSRLKPITIVTRGSDELPASKIEFETLLAPVVNKIEQDKAGRSYATATTSTQGIKAIKNSMVAWSGTKIELTYSYYLALLFAIGMKLIDNDKSERILVLREAIRYIDPETGKLREDEVIKALRKKLTKRNSHKGRDEFIELKNNVLAFNNPQKYGYFVKIGVDATAQMWSLYASVILRSKKLAGRTNLIPAGNNFMLNKINDFNTEALNIFIETAGLKGREKKIVQKYGRDAIKKWIMPPGYGAGENSSFRMCAKHADGHPELLPILKRYFNIAFHERFLEALIPGFFKFSKYMKSQAIVGGNTSHEEDFENGRDIDYWHRIAKSRDWWNRRVTIMNLGGLYRVLGHTYIPYNETIANFNGVAPYISKYVQDTINPKGDNPYRLFMIANTAHTLDAWLVRYVKNDMMRNYGVSILTNHDAYYAHPEYLFAVMSSYVNGLKTLVQLYDRELIEYMVRQWTDGKGNVKDFLIDDFDIDEFINTPNELLFALLWG